MKIDKTPYSILVVEDNPGDYLLVEDYLLEHIQAPTLTHVTRFKEADGLLSGHTSFDIVLLDLSLPDIDRELLTVEARRLSATCPVVILTGYPDVDLATRSLAMGVSDYLVKDTINALILYKSVVYSIERHRFVQSLRESEKRYSDLFHLSPAPMWVYDTTTFEILDVNEAAVRHYGYDRIEFLGKSVKEIRHRDDHHRFPSDSETAHHKDTVRHITKSGTLIHVEIQTASIEFNGRPCRLVLSTDITENLKQIKAIEEQNKRLRDIAWTQSHVVRAPVARLMGLIDLIRNGNLDDTERNEMLAHVFASCEEIDLIIRDIVDKSQFIINRPETEVP